MVFRVPLVRPTKHVRTIPEDRCSWSLAQAVLCILEFGAYLQLRCCKCTIICVCLRKLPHALMRSCWHKQAYRLACTYLTCPGRLVGIESIKQIASISVSRDDRNHDGPNRLQWRPFVERGRDRRQRMQPCRRSARRISPHRKGHTSHRCPDVRRTVHEHSETCHAISVTRW